MVGENGIYLLSMKETKFKHTEIGLIPEDWEILSLGDIGDVRMCKRILKHQTSSVGDIPFYKIGTFGKEPDAFISRELFEEYRRLYNYPKQGDVLLSAAGTIGRTVLFDGKDAYFQDSNIVWIENNERKLLNGLLYYIYNKINWVADTGTIPRIYNDIVRKIFISFPPTKAEQSRIATALYDIDTLIRNLDRTIEKKKNIRQGAMEQLLSGKKRLPGFKGEWEQVEIGNVCKRMKRGEVLSAAEMNTGVFPVIAAGTEPAGHCDKYNRNPMTISVSGSGANAGFVAFHKNRIFATDCFTIGASEEYDVEFIYYVLKMRQKEIFKLQTGGAQPHVYPRDLSSMSVYYTADLQEQRAIADTLTAMDDEIAVLQMERDKYANIRSGMMDDLLSGAKRI